MCYSIAALSFLATLIVIVLFAIAMSLYFADKEQSSIKQGTPWLAVLLYSVGILVDWFFAYNTQQLSGKIVYAWFYVFPLISYFYLTFCVLALAGVYYRKQWGFNLAYITLVTGVIFYANTILLVYDLSALMPQFFTLILILNSIILIYLAVYQLEKKIEEK